MLPGEEASDLQPAAQGGKEASDIQRFALSEESGGQDEGEVERPEPFRPQECHNLGPPLSLEWDGKVEPITDGFGLCSPTRWQPESRGALPYWACPVELFVARGFGQGGWVMLRMLVAHAW